MKPLNYKVTVKRNSIDSLINELTEKLKQIGFGILTRIDFHQKIKEKLGKDIKPTVILGACNPGVAYEAFQINTDTTALIPCNVVIRETAKDEYSVEIASPSTLLSFLPGMESVCEKAEKLDQSLNNLLKAL